MSLVKTATTTLLALTLVAHTAIALEGDDSATASLKSEENGKTSDLDVNSHKQNTAFEDKDHDMIEDLSVDPMLEAAEKAEEGDSLKPVGGSILDNMLKVDDEKPDDYVEEETLPDGSHIKKHVHKGPGFQQVSIESDHPLNIGEIMGQLLGQAQQRNPTSARGGGGAVVQHTMSPLVLGPPLPLMVDPFDAFLDGPEEDPFEIIRQMQRDMEHRRRNSGPFGGMFAGTPTIHAKPDNAPALAETLGEGVEHVFPPHTEHHEHQEHHVYNDVQQHSPLYMFMCVVVVAALGFALWIGFIKDAANVGTARKSREPEQREISLNRFNKRA